MNRKELEQAIDNECQMLPRCVRVTQLALESTALFFGNRAFNDKPVTNKLPVTSPTACVAE